MTELTQSEPSSGTPEWPARIVFGEPTNKDEFDGGGHDRSARALADGVKQLSERMEGRRRAGGAVGLEGAWGSGKSTVIDIARDQYLGDGYVVFTFDLWRHQSDDFRRSLLEQLISFVRSAFNPKGKDGRHIHDEPDPRPKVDLNIDKKHDEIRNRKSVTTTSSKRRITLFGTALAFLLPLLPIGYSLLSPTMLKDATWPSFDMNGVTFGGPVFWMAAGLILYAIAAGLVLSAAFKSGHFTDKDSFKGRTAWLRGGASHLLNLSERDQNNEVTQKIRDESPTTVEFRTVFEEILRPLQDTGKRIVFVLDNIDRIPAGDLAKTWAELRSLIAGNGPDPATSVLAVIPYDRDHVGQAFPPMKLPRYVEKDGELQLDRAVGIDVETDVFEKTFDRIIKVSAPVPSAWKRFLLDRIGDAAFQGKHEADYQEKLFRLLQFQLQREGSHPTPRRIISFVNDIGGLWAQWSSSTIPIATVGLYVLHRPLFDRDPSILTKAQPVHQRFVRIVHDEDYAKHLAALAFNVPPDLANQVRLGAPITMALMDNDGHGELGEFAKSDGFHEIFPNVLRERLTEWADGSPELIARAASNVARVELPSELNGAVWQIFADAIDDIDTLHYENATLPGLYLIVERQVRQSPEQMAATLRRKFEGDPLDKGDSDVMRKGSLWLHLMRSLTNAVKEAVGPERSKKVWRSKIPSDIDEFNIGAVSAHMPSDLPFKEIELGSSVSSISTTLQGMIEANPKGYQFCMEVIDGRLKDHLTSHLGLIAAAVAKTEPDETQLHLLRAAAHMMRWVKLEAVHDAFVSVRDTSLGNYALWTSHRDLPVDEAAALLVLVTATEGVPMVASRGTPLSEAGVWYNGLLTDASSLPDTVIEELVGQVSHAFETSQWIRLAVNATSDGGLFARVLRAFPRLSWTWISDLKALAKSYDRVQEIAGDDGAEYFLRRMADEKRVKEAFSGALCRIVPTSMIAAMARVDDSVPAKVVLSLIEDHLVKLDADSWRDALTANESDDRRLLVAMQTSVSLEIKSGDFIQALVLVAVDVLEGTYDPAGVRQDWVHVLNTLPFSQFTTLRAQIMTKMQKADVTEGGALAFVSSMGKVAHKMRFSATSDIADWSLTHFLWHLANSDDPNAKRYLEANSAEVDAALKLASSDDIRRSFDDLRRVNDADDVETA